MLEMDCVYNSLHDKYEIGRTDDDLLTYFKSKETPSQMMAYLAMMFDRFGLKPILANQKITDDYSVILVEFSYDGSWG